MVGKISLKMLMILHNYWHQLVPFPVRDHVICSCHLHDDGCVGFDMCDDDLDDEDDQFKDDPISHIDVKVVNEYIRICCLTQKV